MHSNSVHDLAPISLELGIDCVHESLSNEVVTALLNFVGILDKNGQIFSHLA